jgi:hypothetical protein
MAAAASDSGIDRFGHPGTIPFFQTPTLTK